MMHFFACFPPRSLSRAPPSPHCSDAGFCEMKGGICSIRLSAPLLWLRTAADAKSTLLHEMIHAYMFLTRPDTKRE